MLEVQEAQAGIADGRDAPGGLVGAAVADHHDLEMLVALAEDGRQAPLRQELRTIVGGDAHAHQGADRQSVARLPFLELGDEGGVHLHARFQNVHLLGLVSDPVAHLFELGAQSLQGADLLVQPPRFRFMSGPLGLMLGFVRVPFRVAPAAFELHRGNDVLERLQPRSHRPDLVSERGAGRGQRVRGPLPLSPQITLAVGQGRLEGGRPLGGGLGGALE